MEKIWLKNYPAGIPAEINADEYSSLNGVIAEACTNFASRPAFTNMGKSLTYGELDRMSNQFAAYLQGELGLKKGDRIAIQLPNILQFPVALYGALRAGLIVVNTNPLYTAREMKHQFRDSGATAIVILANFADKLQEILPETQIKHIVVTEIGDLLPFPKSAIVNFVLRHVKKMVPKFKLDFVSMQDALAKGSRHELKKVAVAPSDVAFLQYTGGTTGVSKGAMLTHRNVIANMQMISAWITKDLKAGSEVVMTPLPLYHIFSLTVNCLGFAKKGANMILVTNPRDIPAFVREIRKSRPTAMSVVNTLVNAVLHQPGLKREDFSSLKITVAGGMALQTSVSQKWTDLTGTHIAEGYGLTECSPVVACNPIDGSAKVGSIGIPLPSTEIKIVDDDGKEVGIGETGELCVHGPQVMTGYWNQPEETAAVLGKDGWLKTGDMAVIESDGYTRIVDRKKDMILVSGFNVYPNEIEEVCAMNPKVQEVAAVGIPDEHSGEVVKVFVVRKDPSLTSEELRAFCKTQLTSYKVPKEVAFLAELPKNNVGKILRRMLRS